MYRRLLLIILLFGYHYIQAQVKVEKLAELPEGVTNNAVCEGFIMDFPLVYSFGGIDSTLSHSGIHQRSYRYNTITGELLQLPDLPDTLGKIASSASLVGNIIYIIGGYHVFEDGSERSSNKVHRYDIVQNAFLSDGEPIPVPIDDHVQAVWRDSLIYVITGWSDNQNVPNVQIYNPAFDTWTTGENVPNLNIFKSFGASGTILNDTIFYFGGAASTSGFPIQSALRKGVINPDNPQDIQWTATTPDQGVVGYRMASCKVRDEIHWVGGSNVTYNFDALSYSNSRVVQPNERDLVYTPGVGSGWTIESAELPMDLRGIGEINDTVKYLIGGILKDREVSKGIWRLKWSQLGTGVSEVVSKKRLFYFYPNPVGHELRVQGIYPNHRIHRVEIFTMRGRKILDKTMNTTQPRINFRYFQERAYIIRIWDQNGNSYIDKILKR